MDVMVDLPIAPKILMMCNLLEVAIHCWGEMIAGRKTLRQARACNVAGRAAVNLAGLTAGCQGKNMVKKRANQMASSWTDSTAGQT